MQGYTEWLLAVLALAAGCMPPAPEAVPAAALLDTPLALSVCAWPAAVTAGREFSVHVAVRNFSNAAIAIPADLSLAGYGVARVYGAGDLERAEGMPAEQTFLAAHEVLVLEPGGAHEYEFTASGSLTAGLPGGDYALVVGLLVPAGVTEHTGLLYTGLACSEPVLIRLAGSRFAPMKMDR